MLKDGRCAGAGQQASQYAVNPGYVYTGMILKVFALKVVANNHKSLRQLSG